MPEISYENLKNCKILVKDDLLEEFMKENWDSLKDDPGNCVAAISEPTRMYRMKYGCMIDRTVPCGVWLMQREIKCSSHRK